MESCQTSEIYQDTPQDTCQREKERESEQKKLNEYFISVCMCVYVCGLPAQAPVTLASPHQVLQCPPSLPEEPPLKSPSGQMGYSDLEPTG